MSRGEKGSKHQRTKEARRLARETRRNEEAAQVRIGQHGGNWRPLPVKDFAKRNGLTINFAGFWRISESGKKVEGTDPNSGLTFVMDSTRAYYRVMNADGQYVDADGQTQGRRGNDEFNAVSHFRNRAD